MWAQAHWVENSSHLVSFKSWLEIETAERIKSLVEILEEDAYLRAQMKTPLFPFLAYLIAIPIAHTLEVCVQMC